MTPEISQGIVGAQVILLALTVLLSFAATARTLGLIASWISSLLALVAVGIAAAALAPGSVLGMSSADNSMYAMYAGIAFGAAILNWVGLSLVGQFMRVRAEKALLSPRTGSRAAEELREILRREGLELDNRLQQAERDREQFLYALEDRHAQQIAGLAQEYQHEAHTILRQLLDQLAAEQLQPMVEQRLAEHQQSIESELGAIDSAAAGETLTTLRAEMADLLEQVKAAEDRVAKARDENPDTTMEEHVQARLEAIDDVIAERLEATKAEFDSTLATTIVAIDGRIAEVGTLLDEKIDAAGSPLAKRMVDTEQQVEQRLQSYMDVLTGRFSETEEILNTRIIEQEKALEGRVIEMETAVDGRLAQHSVAIEQVLGEHDRELHDALSEQTTAVGQHFSSERDRLIGELTEHAVTMQEKIAGELVAAETRARETVEATQVAWNHFTSELEERFAQTREEALRAAKDIAAAERDALETELAHITQGASADIAAKVEMLGREAAWQRAQVERTVFESMDRLKGHAQDSIANADIIFADLDRIGADRVDSIRRQAEDALVQSRDYVGQLQDSLGAHLDSLRDRSGELADEMNERLNTITHSSHQAATHVENYSREIVETTSRELAAVAEQQVQSVQQRISHDLMNSIQANLADQQRQYETHLAEIAQRIMQQVQGDLAGLAEHARGAVTGELETIVVQAREQSRQAQEQGFMQIMNELARQQAELGEQARSATDQNRGLLDESLKGNRRQLEEAMASMGAHMREELVRFHDEGQRRVNTVIEQLRAKEHEMLREEDRKLGQARSELVRQHQGKLEQQVKDLVGGLGGALSSPLASPTGGMTFAANVGQGGGDRQMGFSQGLERPATPLVGGHDQNAAQQQAPQFPQGPPQPQTQPYGTLG